MPGMNIVGRHSLGEAIERLSRRWGWMLLCGIIFAVLGLVALGLVFSATIASVIVIGIFMALAGGMEIVVGFESATWGHFFLWIAAGLLYLVAGAIVIARPLEAAAFFTIVLGALLLATGIARLWVALHQPSGKRSLPVVSALITLVFGLVIILGWPGNSFYVLGILLGVDLVFYGANWIAFALALRSLAHNRS